MRVITSKDGSEYLTRWTVMTLGIFGRIVVHYFHRPDEDEEQHDHPWWFISIILRGWYVEELGGEGRMIHRRAGSIAFRQAAVPHRVSAISHGGVWSLLWTGPDTGREWGFYTKRGWVPWRKFLNLPEEDAILVQGSGAGGQRDE